MTVVYYLLLPVIPRKNKFSWRNVNVNVLWNKWLQTFYAAKDIDININQAKSNQKSNYLQRKSTRKFGANVSIFSGHFQKCLT
jgi:hypothetical protein